MPNYFSDPEFIYHSGICKECSTHDGPDGIETNAVCDEGYFLLNGESKEDRAARVKAEWDALSPVEKEHREQLSEMLLRSYGGLIKEALESPILRFSKFTNQ